ncbi:hypothetical protein PBI_CORAL_33 [Arthrobacter phage Coral]|uniref:Uncharacterized protein n=2 Tax=Coralvirus coral TaxID=2734227 RepID=A0A3G2KF41_9CAUD|nr:hypothetical protein HOU54_gp33 [Arthrobacter phage Coral]AYN57508.1 hypothetical protein PBI_CORAL_33 [Arthrobacter phage Coral]AYN57608.1 hypothetical protein PBI_COTE_35 [Arthrobacter phage Cote]
MKRERTDRQVLAAVRELQRKLDNWWTKPNARALLTITAAPSADLAEIIITVTATDSGATLQERRLDRNAKAWDLYRAGKTAASIAVSDAIGRYLEEHTTQQA